MCFLKKKPQISRRYGLIFNPVTAQGVSQIHEKQVNFQDFISFCEVNRAILSLFISKIKEEK